MITTFLHQWELDVPTGIKELDELLVEVKELTGENFQIVKHYSPEYPPFWAFWRKVKQHEFFGLYVYVGGRGRMWAVASN